MTNLPDKLKSVKPLLAKINVSGVYMETTWAPVAYSVICPYML